VYASYILLPDEMTVAFDEPTLMRWLFNWSFRTSAGAATGNQVLNLQLGLIKLSMENVTNPFAAASLAYVPLPFDDGDSAWIWQLNYTGILGVSDALLVQSGPPSVTEVKTRRKIENGEGLALIASTKMEVAATGGVSGWLSFSGRFLLLNR